MEHHYAISRRVLLLQLLWLAGCTTRPNRSLSRLTVGVVSYDEGARSVEQYEVLKTYLAEQLNAIVELEPAYNELQALAQIERQVWSLVFAPPGLAAIAISQHQYQPILPMLEAGNQRAVLVVPAASPLRKLTDLAGQVIGLGEPGSAAGYYLPLYDLYGLVVAEVRFAPTPRTLLQWLSDGTVAAGALSKTDFQRYQTEFGSTRFRVIHTSSKKTPSSVVLTGPIVDRTQQEFLLQALNQAPAQITTAAGYVPDTAVPVYQEFIKIVNKVQPITTHLKDKPAALIK